MEALETPSAGSVAPASPPAQKRKAFSNIELLRFIGVFGMMVSHYHHFGFSGLRLESWYDAAKQPFYNFLKFEYVWGWTSVELFWLMSGFIFAFQYGDSIRNRLVSGRSFAIFRISRLYPLHIVTAFLVFGLQFWYRSLHPHGISLVYPNNNLGDLGLALFMAGDWNPYAAFSLNGPFWSVSVEIIAYALFFFLFRYFKFPWWVVAFGPAILFFTTFFEFNNMITDCTSFFLTGAAMYLAYKQFDRIKNTTVRDIISGLLISGVLIFAFILNQIGSVEALRGHQFYLFYGMLICALGAAATLPQASGKLGRFFDGVGNTTYASLLIHFPLQLIAMICFTSLGIRAPYMNPWLFVSWLLATYVLSFMSFRWFEQPVQNWMRKKFKATKPQK